MRKKKQKLYKSKEVNNLEYNRIIKIVIGVLIFLAIVYFVTAITTGEIKFGKKKTVTKTETSIQYQEIMAGETFNRTDKEYYVLFYNGTGTFANYFKSKLSVYSAMTSKLPFYTVDLEKQINKKYIEESDVTPSDINSLKVTEPTILKVKDGKGVEVIKGKDNVLNFFD